MSIKDQLGDKPYVPHYPDAPGYKVPGTSRDAADAMRPRAGSLRDRCLSVIAAKPSTADEVATVLGETVLAIRPRISELRVQGEIVETGDRRRNSSGKDAAVWRIANALDT